VRTTGFHLLYLSCNSYAIHFCFKVSRNHSERAVNSWNQYTPDSQLWWCRKSGIGVRPPTLSSCIEAFWKEIVVFFKLHVIKVVIVKYMFSYDEYVNGI